MRIQITTLKKIEIIIVILMTSSLFYGNSTNYQYVQKIKSLNKLKEPQNYTLYTDVFASQFLPNTIILIPYIGGVVTDSLGVSHTIWLFNILYLLGQIIYYIAIQINSIMIADIGLFAQGMVWEILYMSKMIYIVNTYLQIKKNSPKNDINRKYALIVGISLLVDGILKKIPNIIYCSGMQDITTIYMTAFIISGINLIGNSLLLHISNKILNQKFQRIISLNSSQNQILINDEDGKLQTNREFNDRINLEKKDIDGIIPLESNHKKCFLLLVAAFTSLYTSEYSIESFVRSLVVYNLPGINEVFNPIIILIINGLTILILIYIFTTKINNRNKRIAEDLELFILIFTSMHLLTYFYLLINKEATWILLILYNSAKAAIEYLFYLYFPYIINFEIYYFGQILGFYILIKALFKGLTVFSTSEYINSQNDPNLFDPWCWMYLLTVIIFGLLTYPFFISLMIKRKKMRLQ